ncbi:MAG: hypothetical protein IJ133_01205 [Clostridia bacterium]|nr:hypothetical protein [Clostridia bacterium]
MGFGDYLDYAADNYNLDEKTVSKLMDSRRGFFFGTLSAKEKELLALLESDPEFLDLYDRG